MHGDKGCVRIDITLSPNAVLPKYIRKSKQKHEPQFAPFKFVKEVFEFAKEDINRVLFSLKVGLAMVIVSLLILITQPYEVFGANIVWSILTVAIMFEYTVGATLNRGFNRAIGSLIAGLIAFVVIQITLLMGCKVVPYIIGVSIFLVATITSFMKLWPCFAQYEHGFRVIVFTYCLTIVSAYRNGDQINTVLTRLYCIAIGAVVAVSVNVVLFPVWSGEQLHKEIAASFYDLAYSFEECVKNYLKSEEFAELAIDEFPCRPSFENCKTILNSSLRIDSLVNFAKWEPPHGRFNCQFFYPWSEYVKVSSVLRHCAYEITALHGYLHSDLRAPYSLKLAFLREIFEAKSRATELILHLGNNMSNMKHCPIETMMLLKSVHGSIFLLKQSIDFQFYSSLALTKYYDSWPSDESELDGEEIVGQSFERVKSFRSLAALSFSNFVLVLIEFVSRLDGLVDCVDQLSKIAKFKPVVP